MIRIAELKLPLAQAEQPEPALRAAAAALLGVAPDAIARLEVFKRSFDARKAELLAVFIVDLALAVRSPDGRSYAERLRQAQTERALSDMFEDFIGTVPLGRRLFADDLRNFGYVI